ncbi:MAG: MoxR family ATPase [Proteobacteria bacterium]|nr:MoxR family ATPase [Pseudomonadota bacterium]
MTQPQEDTELKVERFHHGIRVIRAELEKIIVGQHQVLDQLLITVLIGGHCLITGLPGTAKTLMVQSLADALGLDFKRVQFTPDLMPTDVTGTDIIDVDPATGERQWRFVPGPIFANLLLADEINRTPPKTQSALLEAMQEAHVTIRGQTHMLAQPFVVLATQNPIELEGTYPLPEAQLDRFIFNVMIDYLDADEEVAVVERNTLGLGMPKVNPCATAEGIIEMQQLVRQVPISDAMNRYAVNLVRATRPLEPTATERVRQYVTYGASVRAAINLSLAARARALLNGRYHVIEEDISELAAPILRHRLQLNYLAESDQVNVDDLISDLLVQVRHG